LLDLRDGTFYAGIEIRGSICARLFLRRLRICITGPKLMLENIGTIVRSMRERRGENEARGAEKAAQGARWTVRTMCIHCDHQVRVL